MPNGLRTINMQLPPGTHITFNIASSSCRVDRKLSEMSVVILPITPNTGIKHVA
jgi:hypothetical protein